MKRPGAADPLRGVGVYGGAFKVTDGLQARFGEQRVIDTPISEIAIIGSEPGVARNLGDEFRCITVAASRPYPSSQTSGPRCLPSRTRTTENPGK